MENGGQERMNPKIVKITGDMKKIQDRIAGLQARLRELDRQKKELENAEIVAAVRGMKATPGELEALLNTMRGADAAKSTMEDSTDEEV
jgi:predicted  nucleic acid-binding Zn-ribbon protein